MQPAGAQASHPLRFISAYNGKCIDIEEASLQARADAQVYGCHPGENQKFRLVDDVGVYFKIVAEHSGQCLDVRGASTNPERQIQQYPCHDEKNQKWKKRIDEDGKFALENLNSGLCMSVVKKYNILHWKDDLVQADCVSTPNQLFFEQPANCGDGVCRLQDGEDEYTCPEDCGDPSSPPSWPPSSCPSGFCEAGETCATCEADCGICPSVGCGDGICSGGLETCASCPFDCGLCSLNCGNGSCDRGEDCWTCPGDCPGICDPI